MFLVSTALLLIVLTICAFLAFGRILFSVNLMSAFFYFTMLFSVAGVYIYAFTDLFLYQYQFLKLDYLGPDDFVRAILIAHGGVLLILLGYALPARATRAFVRSPGLFPPPHTMSARPTRVGVKIVLGLVIGLTLLFATRQAATLLNVQTILRSLVSHTAQIELRADVGVNFAFVVFTTCILTYVSTYFCALRSWSGVYRNLWILLVVLTAYLHLGIFQKRPLLVYLITIVFVFVLTRPGFRATKKRMIRLALIAGGLGFGSLVLLYWLIFAGIESGFSIGDVLFISMMQTMTRLSNSVLLTAYIYPEFEPFFGLGNVRILGLLFDFDYYNKDAVMFEVFSTSGSQDGTTASAAMIDFYGGFGWTGMIVLCPLLGFFLYLVESYIRSQPHSLDRFVFSIFTLWFVYYLTQANFFRAAHGYGFFYFIVMRYLLLLSLSGRRQSRRRTDEDRPARNGSQPGYP